MTDLQFDDKYVVCFDVSFTILEFEVDVFIDSKNQNIDEKIDTHRTNTVQIKIKTALQISTTRF